MSSDEFTDVYKEALKTSVFCEDFFNAPPEPKTTKRASKRKASLVDDNSDDSDYSPYKEASSDEDWGRKKSKYSKVSTLLE